MLDDGAVIDLGGRRVRYVDRPHVPHAWELGLIYEERAIAAEDEFKASSLAPATPPTLHRLARLNPAALR